MKATRKRTKRRINWEDVYPEQTMTLPPKGAFFSSTRRKMGRKFFGINASAQNEEEEDEEEREEKVRSDVLE